MTNSIIFTSLLIVTEYIPWFFNIRKTIIIWQINSRKNNNVKYGSTPFCPSFQQSYYSERWTSTDHRSESKTNITSFHLTLSAVIFDLWRRLKSPLLYYLYIWYIVLDDVKQRHDRVITCLMFTFPSCTSRFIYLELLRTLVQQPPVHWLSPPFASYAPLSPKLKMHVSAGLTSMESSKENFVIVTQTGYPRITCFCLFPCFC